MSNRNSKYPFVRIRREFYEDVKMVADRKGISMGEALEYTWKSSLSQMPKETEVQLEVKNLEERIKELEEQLKQSDVSKLMNEIEIKNSEIERLKDIVSNLEIDNKALKELVRKSSSEVKWIKENIKKDLEDMLKANSLWDIQSMLRTLVNRIEGLNLDNLLI